MSLRRIQLLACVLASLLGARAASVSTAASLPCGEARVGPPPADAWRVVAVVAGEDDPAVARAVASLGANTVATLSPPRADSAAVAASAGLGYLPRLSIEDIDRLITDSAFLTLVRGLPNLVGFQYIDVVEGYATVDTPSRPLPCSVPPR